MKPADAVIVCTPGTAAEITYPSLTKNYHHEVELVVAIGKGGREHHGPMPRHIFGRHPGSTDAS